MKNTNVVRLVLRVTPEEYAAFANSAQNDDRSLAKWARRGLRECAGLPAATSIEAQVVSPQAQVVSPQAQVVSPQAQVVSPQAQVVGKLRPDGLPYEAGWPQMREGILFHSYEEAYDHDAKNWKPPVD
jgi:hypothetical protein